MREFIEYEFAKAKCPVCGCRNKVYTPLYDTEQENRCRCCCGEMEDLKVGYRLRCCNCGGEKYFITDHIRNGKPIRERSQLVMGDEKCYQPSFCPHKECPLFGSCQDFWKRYKPCTEHNGVGSIETKHQQQFDHNLSACNSVTVELVEKPKFL